MKMKVAIFCPSAMLSRVKKIAIDKELEFKFFPYMQTKELFYQVEKAYVCDIYLFAEQIPYLLVKNKAIKKTTPCIYISLNEYMLLTTLSLLKQEREQNWNRISMDVCDEKPVYNVLSELDLQDNDIYLLQTNEWMLHDFTSIVEHHQRLWKQGKIDYVLTSIEEVKEKLKQKKIPARKIHTPSLNIKLAIEEARQVAKLRQYQLNTTQIVIGYIQLKSIEANVQSFDSNVQLRHIVDEFAHQNNACVVTNKHNRVMLFGTNSMLDHIKRHYRDFPLLHVIERRSQLPVAIGFGLGLNAKRAKENAKKALKICLDSNESKCYLVNENQDTIGPIGITKTFDTSKLYQALIHKARLNNEISYNFIQFVTLRNNEPFSSHDFALHYKVTKRSAERTINKLLAGKVIKVTGEEKPYIRGRPRKLFSLNL
ncbi:MULTISPECIES: hypothetical protein [Clostridia]|uniref:hypothetical protein n=1 Tax=Clostridia TaxID=186801 RepID=UPI000EA1A6D2|nr:MULTISPECIES: hypothetical protein [Clostridia]NBJ70252.1 hypothetical protein [Roseburia sp. 1XD42-34]RKI76701.1 hypothetical protein D7V87_12575 [Clostridium sp. 1xD42-85]